MKIKIKINEKMKMEMSSDEDEDNGFSPAKPPGTAQNVHFVTLR